ncbi:MAG TPA: molybdopterin molybdotransferase MoeA [Holophagaceae bacterium]|nr:molybdopterin molybdotransferase MoeA [Holophagaceae bacterium]
MGVCDEGHLMDVNEALRRLAEAIPIPGLPAFMADRDDPALDRSAMDGVALRAVEGTGARRLLGTLYAGDDPALFQVGHGEAVAIMTGACLPPGADAVVPVERLERQGEVVVPLEAPKPGDHVRRQGEQARAGDRLLEAGRPWSAPRAALAAQIGRELPLPRRPVVGIAPTGDELVADPSPWQIRDSNGPMLEALAFRLGAEVRRLPRLEDEAGALERALRNLQGVDILLTSGGVSMGEKDLLPGVLTSLGADLLFHRIRLKPGKPMLAARLGGLTILGLPGNPVSAYLNALLFLPVALARLQGAEPLDPWKEGELTEAVANKGDRPLLHPCRLQEGRLSPLPSQGSADLVRLAQADACAWIAPGGTPAGKTRYLLLP